MGSPIPPLRGALIIFHKIHKLLSQCFGLRLARDVAMSFLRRLVFWLSFLSAKIRRRKTDDSSPKGRPQFPGNTKQRDMSYTVVRDGETVPLRGVAPSLYPFSSGGIRNGSRSSIRAPRLESRSASRSSQHMDSDYAHSDRTSFYELEVNPSVLRPPSRLSRSPSRLSRTTSRHRIPHRQFSTSLPDLNNSRDGQRPPLHLSPYSRAQSPAPAVDIELASPVEAAFPDESTTVDVSNPFAQLHRHRQPTTITEVIENPRDTISCSSPPPAGEAVSISHTYSETSLRVPSESVSSSAPYFTNSVTSLSTTITKGIRPTIPEETYRFKGRTRREKKYTYFEVVPITTVFDQPASPPGWLTFLHPEGNRYFYHPIKRAYTDSELGDSRIYDWLMDAIDRLERLGKTLARRPPPDAMLTIDVVADGDNLCAEYYYASHSEKTIFWLHSFTTDQIRGCSEIYGPQTLRHLSHALRAQYWYFVQLYPNSLTLTPELICELRDIILHYIGDVMTSPTSTCPYACDALYQILTATDAMEKNCGGKWHGATSLLGRHMYIFTLQQFLDCHGETYARVDRDFSIYGDNNTKRTWLIKSFSLLLFSAPEVHLRNLHNVWVDKILHRNVWKETTKKLNDEWQEFVFFATVMLTSNVGYLAIQSVDIDDGDRRSAGQISSYLSVVANLGSIIIGLLLMRQNRTKARESADEVQLFLQKRNHPTLGLETLAILYSLPYAFLMWGVVSFLVAFCCIFFDNATTQSRSLVGFLSIVVAASIVWCIAISWETVDSSEPAQRPLVYNYADLPTYIELPEETKQPPKPPVERILEMLKIIKTKIKTIPTLVPPLYRKSEESEKTVV